MSQYFNPNSSLPEQFRGPTPEQLEFLQAIDKTPEEFLEKNSIDILSSLFPEKSEKHIKRILDELRASGWMDFVTSEPSCDLNVRVTEEGQRCIRDYEKACEERAQFLQ